MILDHLIRRSSIYAGIGSRSTSPSALLLLEEVAATLATYKLVLRSGGAPGADTAFERGCDRASGRKEIFLPWKGFNGSRSPCFPPSGMAEMLASLCHPNWRACSQAVRKLHARNCQQVLGKDLDHPADFILFWAPEENGVVKGGTATAIFLAREKGIPTFNLWDHKTRANWIALVKANEQRRRSLWARIFQ